MLTGLFAFFHKYVFRLWTIWIVAVGSFLTWAMQAAVDFVKYLYEQALQAVPPEAMQYIGGTKILQAIDAVSPYVGVANHYLPLDILLLTAISMFTVLGAIRVVRWALSFVPFAAMG